MNTDGIPSLVHDALAGSDRAWVELVRRLEPHVWKAVRMATTDRDVREEAAAATWLVLAEHLAHIHDPHCLPSWLWTTATRQVFSIGTRASRHRANVATLEPAVFTDDLSALFGGDDLAAVRSAFERLNERCRLLLTLLVIADEPATYADAAHVLGMSIGALGPTRQRCLAALRRDPAVVRMLEPKE